MITKRDKEIVKFVERYGGITPKICSKAFFRNNKEAYDQARKRLRVIYGEGLLKRYRKDIKSEAIYYIDKKLKVHDLKLIDVIGELYEFRVHLYTKEKLFTISENRYIIDGAIVLETEADYKRILIEIDYTHYTSINKIKDVISYLENKHKKGYYFLVVKLTQEEIEVQDIGKYSKLFFLPWNLKEFSQVITSLRSDIEREKVLNNR